MAFPTLQWAAAELSEAYRARRTLSLSTPERLTAYLVTRMPATYAASYSVIGEVRRLLGDRPVATVLDVGAGAGAASLAARRWFPAARLMLIERDPAMAEAAREFLPDAEILPRDLGHGDRLPPADLVLASYSFSEFSASARLAISLWTAARVALAIVEPGTPRNFQLLLDVRGQLLEGGASLLAPCPGPVPCPMVGGDWCHFGARVERSSLHRRLKGGALGYEDEKYSYLAFVRDPVPPAVTRIVRRPEHRPGLIALEVCTPQGLRQVRATKRDRDLFREARHAGWGDAMAGISLEK